MKLLLICPKCIKPSLRVSLDAKTILINNEVHYPIGWEEIYECQECSYVGIKCIEANAPYLEIWKENKKFAEIKAEKAKKLKELEEKKIIQQKIIKEQQTKQEVLKISQEIKQLESSIQVKQLPQPITKQETLNETIKIKITKK